MFGSGGSVIRLYCCCQDVSNNQLLQLPVTVSQLRSLRILSVRNNQLVELPSGMVFQIHFLFSVNQ